MGCELYGLEVSPDLISTVTDAVLETVAEWRNRPLETSYPLVFFDAIRVKIRAEGLVSTPEQDCIAFRSKDASMMPTRMPSRTGLSRGRQVGVRSSLGVSALLRRERRLL